MCGLMSSAFFRPTFAVLIVMSLHALQERKNEIPPKSASIGGFLIMDLGF